MKEYKRPELKIVTFETEEVLFESGAMTGNSYGILSGYYDYEKDVIN